MARRGTYLGALWLVSACVIALAGCTKKTGSTEEQSAASFQCDRDGWCRKTCNVLGIAVLAGLEAEIASVRGGQGLSRDEAYAKAKANLESWRSSSRRLQKAV